jgi:hypothetical protein
MGTLVFNRLNAAADFRLTARQARIGAAAVAIAMIAVAALQIFLSKDLVTPSGTPVGGDFAAFWTAAKAMAAGDAAAIYDPAVFTHWLERMAPPQDAWGLTWQYPPTYFLVVGFLAVMPYGLGYALWSGGGLTLFAASSWRAGVRGEALLIMLAAPVVFQAFITGQNGFLTTSLLLGATLLPDKRPLLAGLCAALLTVKPQLGLLLPIAYMAGGHWRAFGYAAAGSALLAGASVAAFGFHPWAAFFDSVLGVGAHVGAGVMPLHKMPTVFAAFAMAGTPAPAALVFHLLGAAAAAWATWAVWRRSGSSALKAAVVCAGAFLVAPYGYYYELVIIAAPLTLLAMEAARDGWRRHDHLMLAGLFLIPMLLPWPAAQQGFNIAFVVTALAFVFVLRRMKNA